MSRPHQLFQLCADLPPMIGREVARAAIRAFSASELIEWKALQNAARQSRFRARHKNVCPLGRDASEIVADVTRGAKSNAVSESMCVIFEEESNDEPTSGSVTSGQLSPSSPPVSPAPPSSPTPTPTHEGAVAGSAGNASLLTPDGGCAAARPKSLEQIVAYCNTLGLPATDAEVIWRKWQGNGFTNNHRRMCNWQAVIRSWQLQGYLPSQKHHIRGSARAAPPYRRISHVTPANLSEPITAF